MQAVADVIGVTFDEVHQKMLDHYQPADALEETLVRRIARCTWKLRLLETMEDGLLQGLQVCEVPVRSLDGISIIERRTDVQLHRAIAALAHKRKQDQENEKNKLTELPPTQSDAQPQSALPQDSTLGQRSGLAHRKPSTRAFLPIRHLPPSEAHRTRNYRRARLRYPHAWLLIRK